MLIASGGKPRRRRAVSVNRRGSSQSLSIIQVSTGNWHNSVLASLVSTTPPVLFLLIYFLVLVFQLFFNVSFVLVFIIFSFLVFVNKFVILSFFTIFVNENHSVYHYHYQQILFGQLYLDVVIVNYDATLRWVNSDTIATSVLCIYLVVCKFLIFYFWHSILFQRTCWEMRNTLCNIYSLND